MPAGTPRGGIEWRILKSILLIGALPLIVAIVGLLIAARGQTTAVQENLSIAAVTTSYGLRNAASTRLDALERLARNPRIVASLIPSGREGRPTLLRDRQAVTDVTDFLGRFTQGDSSVTRASVYTLYDAQGEFVLSTKVLGAAPPPSRSSWPDEISGPQFVDLEYLAGENRYLAEAVSPVVTDAKRERIGFIAETFDITPLLMFGLGYDPYRNTTPPVGDLYQLLAPNVEGEMVAWRLEGPTSAENPRFARAPLQVAFGAFMLGPARGANGTGVVRQLLANGPAQSTFYAYDRIFDGYPLFVLVSRPAAAVYAPIWFWSAMAIAACTLSIGFFYLNAYRNVHNNIVRPVLLLNEGAQIIERGDLELKLKIGTGDEIEELAMSFNKMALALKRNIRQLEDSEEKYRGLVDSMRDGIFQADLDGVIGFVNPAAAEILGFDSQDSGVGTNIRTLFHDAEEVGGFFAELKAKGFVERS
ncbi:MAG: PAS domain-containing protein, partial [Candidatus Hydrogenedentes bacterium]|nr:PAS domain-containing protein [Candidatus Hydrogenedentota bacterium]